MVVYGSGTIYCWPVVDPWKYPSHHPIKQAEWQEVNWYPLNWTLKHDFGERNPLFTPQCSWCCWSTIRIMKQVESTCLCSQMTRWWHIHLRCSPSLWFRVIDMQSLKHTGASLQGSGDTDRSISRWTEFAKKRWLWSSFFVTIRTDRKQSDRHTQGGCEVVLIRWRSNSQEDNMDVIRGHHRSGSAPL